jgi:hypothetical protein
MASVHPLYEYSLYNNTSIQSKIKALNFKICTLELLNVK